MDLPELTFEQAWKVRDLKLEYKAWVLGLRNALELVLEAKGLKLSPAQQERLKSALGLEVRRWVQRVANVSSTDELFSE